MVRKITKNPSQLPRCYFDDVAGAFLEEELVVVHCRNGIEAQEVAQTVAEEVGLDA